MHLTSKPIFSTKTYRLRLRESQIFPISHNHIWVIVTMKDLVKYRQDNKR